MFGSDGTRRRVPRGFSLIELVVALSIGGSVLFSVRMVVGLLADHARIVSESRAELARDVNGARLLRLMLLQSVVGTEPTARFAGDAASITLETWCLMPMGWSERCRADLAITGVTNETVRAKVVAHLSTGERLDLVEVPGPVRFGFLVESEGRREWSDVWSPSPVAPRAIGVFMPGDTIVMRVGSGS